MNKLTIDQAIEVINSEMYGTGKPRHSTEERLEASHIIRELSKLPKCVTRVEPASYGNPMGTTVTVTFAVTPDTYSAIKLLCGDKYGGKSMKKLIKYIRDEDEKCSTDTKLICPVCGVEVSDDMKKCPNCNTPLEDPDDSTIIK